MHKTVITQKQMDNLKLLAEVIEAKKGQPEKVLDIFSQPCGTYGCVLGDYMIKTREGLYGNKLDVLNACDLFWFDESKAEFGYNFWESHRPNEFDGVCVFGPARTGTIQQRLDYVKHLIANSVVDGEDEARAFIASLNQLPALIEEKTK